MDVNAVRFLASPAGSTLLAAARQEYAAADPLKAAAALRRRFPDQRPDLLATALTEARLRVRARDKLGADADRLLLTVDGLEQATRATVAAHRARRVRDLVGAARVADLCCGIGSDLVALARAGLEVTGVEIDPATAQVARANLAALGLPGRVVTGDATRVDRSGCAACVADPARRGARGRVFDPDAFTPPWAWVLEVLGGDACIKTAPGIPHARIPPGVEAEWVSDGGDVVEAALWSGRLRAGDVRRRATVLPGATLTDRADPGGAPVAAPGAVLYEPDGAVIRAGLVTAVAAAVGGALLHPRIAYLTAERHVPTPFATAYAVREVLPLREKVLRTWLRARGVGVLTVKRRGVDVEPDGLRRRLLAGARGRQAATFVVTRSAAREDAAIVLVADRLDAGS